MISMVTTQNTRLSYVNVFCFYSQEIESAQAFDPA
jgi:hypothetical protein